MNNITYSIGLTMGPFQRGIASALSGLRGLASQVAGLSGLAGGIATIGASLGAGFGVLKGIKLAGDLEETATSFEVLLGSAARAKEMLGDIQKFAATTPFEFPELADAGRKLLAFGSGAGDVQKELQQLGALAKGVGAPIGEIAEIYGKARTQGRLFAEDVNQLTGRGIPVIQKFADQFGVNTTEVKKLVETGKIGFPQLQKAIESLTGEGGDFFGMIEKQGRTFNGVLSTLTDSFNALLRTFSEPVMNALKPAMVELSAMLDSMQSTAVEWGKAIADGVRVAVGLFKTGELGTALVLALKLGAMEAVNVLASGLGSVLEAAAKSIGDTLRSAADYLAGKVSDALDSINPVKALDRMVNGDVPRFDMTERRAAAGEQAAADKAKPFFDTSEISRELSRLFSAARTAYEPQKPVLADLFGNLATIFEPLKQALEFQRRENLKKLNAAAAATTEEDKKGGKSNVRAATALAAVGAIVGGSRGGADTSRKQVTLLEKIEKNTARRDTPMEAVF